MKTLGEILQVSTQFLTDKKCARARRVAEELLAHTLNMKRLDLYLYFDRPLMEEELSYLRPLLKVAASGKPIEYITETVSFYHCSISVTPDVLIPRPETEILVDRACKELSNVGPQIAWDVCTGSGCIGISVKKKCPELQVTLSDISEKALTVARKNAEKNGAEVALLQGDLLSPFQGSKADVVFCNPPYVSLKEYETLDRSVKEFEPRLALVAEEEGASFYKKLAEQLPDYLRSHAKVYFEIGKNQADILLKLFSAPVWKQRRIEKDWSGHDRFFFLEFE